MNTVEGIEKMEKWKRSKPKKIYLSITEEQKEKLDAYCRREGIKKQDLLEKHLKGLFNIVDAYFEE